MGRSIAFVVLAALFSVAVEACFSDRNQTRTNRDSGADDGGAPDGGGSGGSGGSGGATAGPGTGGQAAGSGGATGGAGSGGVHASGGTTVGATGGTTVGASGGTSASGGMTAGPGSGGKPAGSGGATGGGGRASGGSVGSGGNGGRGGATATGSGGGTPLVNITIAKQGGGTTGGTIVTGSAGGIDCGSTCSGLIPSGISMLLTAKTTNGSGWYFAGWSGGTRCTGLGGDQCMINITAATTMTATFLPLDKNLIFISSMGQPTNRGSAAAYDADCNRLATAAGINSTAGSDYVAMIADAASTGRSRLGTTARGWLRRDGLPFADTQAALFDTGAVFNPVGLDEYGRPMSSTSVITGSNMDGTVSASATCDNWTNRTGNAQGGFSSGGPAAWISLVGNACSSDRPIVCMGRTRSAAVSVTPASGRRIWLTNTEITVGGTQTPDQKCQAEKPTDVSKAAALIATTDRSAASVLDMAATYVRPDGVVVGTGAELAAGGVLRSGIWQSANGTYQGGAYTGNRYINVWAGQKTLTEVGTAATSCSNWTSATSMGLQGWFADTQRWWVFNNQGCNQPGYLGAVYCVAVP